MRCPPHHGSVFEEFIAEAKSVEAVRAGRQADLPLMAARLLQRVIPSKLESMPGLGPRSRAASPACGIAEWDYPFEAERVPHAKPPGIAPSTVGTPA